MSLSINTDKIDLAIRVLLYNCLFWIPYSPAAIESSVVLSFVLWLLKHSWLCYQYYQKKPSLIAAVKSGFRPAPTILDKPVAFFLLACLISNIVSSYPEPAWTGFFFKTLEWFVVLYLVAETITTLPQVGMAVVIILLTTFSTAVDGIQQFYLTGRDIFNYHELTRGGITAGFKHANSLAAYMVTVLPLFLVIPLLSATKKWQKIFGCVLFLVGGWALFLTFSRMAWLAFICALIVILIVIYRRKAAIIVLIMMLLSGLAVYSLSSTTREQLRLGPKSIVRAVAWRTQIWRESFRLIEEKPLFGTGLNTYMKVFEKKRDQDIHYPLDPTYAHNCYIQMLVEVGLVGLIGFGWILVRLGGALYTVFQEADTARHDLFLLLLGLGAGAAGYLIHSFFDTNLYSLQLSVVFWFLIGLLLSIRRLLKPSGIYGIKNKLKFGENPNG